MNTITELTLDLERPGTPPKIHVKQNDVLSRQVMIHLLDGGSAWILPEQFHAAICYHKPDGTGGAYDTLPDGSPALTNSYDNTLVFQLAPQMMSCAGMVSCEVILMKENQRISSFRWLLEVAEDLESTLTSQDYFRFVTLQNLQDAIEALRAEMAEFAAAQDQRAEQLDDLVNRMQAQVDLRLNTFNQRLSTLSRNPAMITDVTAAFAEIFDEDEWEPMPLDYLIELPDGEYYLEFEYTKYWARLVTVEGCRHADIMEYWDDDSVYHYNYMNGRLASEMENYPQDEPIYLSTWKFRDSFANIKDLQDRVGALERRTGTEITSWEEVQQIVRSGTAKYYFRAGDKFECERDGDRLVWIVLGFDKDKPADPRYTHSMTLQLDTAYMEHEFSPKQAFFYAPDGLDVGTYYFYIDDSPFYFKDENKYYHFTVTTPIPAGAQLVVTKANNVSIVNTDLAVYESPYSTTISGYVRVLAGEEGVDLGSVIGEENINRYDRAQAGNNSYLESTIRQYLNSDCESGEVWEPQTVFDRPARYAARYDGFLYGMDEDFLAVLGPVQKTVSVNKEDVTFEDLVFLLSREEAYGTYSYLSYEYFKTFSTLPYAGTTNDANRIRKYNGVGTAWWLRNPYASDGRCVGGVGAAGNLTYLSCSADYAVVPACCVV